MPVVRGDGIAGRPGPGALALYRQRRDGVARHVNLAGAGQRRQEFTRREVEDQLVVGDGEVLVVRRVEAGTGQDRGAEPSLAPHFALHDRKDRVKRFAVRGEKRVEGDRLLRCKVVVEALVEGGRARTTEILEDLEHRASGTAGWLAG